MRKRRTEKITIGMTEYEAVYTMENDLERFPIPLCFDPKEEQRELWRRKMKIERIIRRMFSLYKLNSLNQ